MKILGIDIGGTNIKFALQDNGKIIDSGKIPSQGKLGGKKVLENIYSICDKYDFDYLGVSTPGLVGFKGEIVYMMDNIPNYTGTPLKQLLEKKYKVKVAVLNDIYAAACSEISSKNKDFYFIALGTGIGGALVADGKIFTGANLFAGQIGSLMSLDGKTTLDYTASVQGLVSLSKDSPIQLFAKANKGDKKAKATLNKWAKEVTNFIKMVIAFVDPKTIILSGGVTKQGNRLIKLLKDNMKSFPPTYNHPINLVIANHNEFAGAVGAIKFAQNKFK